MSFISTFWDDFWEKTGIELISQPLNDPSDDESETILEIPGYRQTKSYTCGFVAGLMILHTFRPTASITNFYHAVSPLQKEGTTTAKLVSALRLFKIGVKTRRNMTFDEIAEAIEDGTPIATTIEKGKDEHWIVIYGYGVGPSRLFIAGNNFAGLPMGTDILWSDYKKLIPSNPDWLICWCK